MEAEGIRRYYAEVEDLRYQGFVECKLNDILILVQCSVMCGLDKLEDIEEYGKNKHDWLKEVFGIERIPSDSTLPGIMNTAIFSPLSQTKNLSNNCTASMVGIDLS